MEVVLQVQASNLQHITDGNRYSANMLADVRTLVHAAVPELEPEQIILMATHTHVAPSVQKDAEYCELASARIAAAIERAWKERKAGGVSFGFGHAVVGHNRIATYSDGTSHMSGSFQKGSFSIWPICTGSEYGFIVNCPQSANCRWLLRQVVD